jgi:transcriptional regulator with XRE-family HTH domain
MRSSSSPTREPHPVTTYRQRHGLSLGQLARRAGISVPTLLRIENGEVGLPTMPIIAKLSIACAGEVSEIDLFRFHYAAAIGTVPALRAPMTCELSWAWVRLPARAKAAALQP